MNYSLAMDSPFNTALLSPEGRAVYRIDTYLSSFTTTVKKVSGGQSEMEIGRVVWQSGRPGTAVVHGHEIYVNKSSFFSSSRTFTALNGQSYKWTFNEGSALMASNDSRQAPVASNEIKSRAATHNSAWSNYHRRRDSEFRLRRRRATTHDEEEPKMMSCGGISNVQTLFRSFHLVFILWCSRLRPFDAVVIQICMYVCKRSFSSFFSYILPMFFFFVVPA